MKQVDVTILGQSYRLGCPEGGEAGLMEAVAMVDREMGAIRDSGKVRARERIAVLAALNLAYALAGQDALGRTTPDAAAPLLPGGPAGAGRPRPDLDTLLARLDQALASAP